MDAQELFNKRYERRMGLNDKFERMNKQFDSYDMIEFAEAHASQQMPSEELLDSLHKALNPKYANSVFTWQTIATAIKSLQQENKTEATDRS